MVARAASLLLLGLLSICVTSAQSANYTTDKPAKRCYSCSYVEGPSGEQDCIYRPWVLTDDHTVPCGHGYECYFTYVRGPGVHYGMRGCTDTGGDPPHEMLKNGCAEAMGTHACHYRCNYDRCNTETPDMMTASAQSLSVPKVSVLLALLMAALLVLM